jgi:cation transport regulator ChaB
MYESTADLPLVCRIHLPEAALKVYRTAFNRAWREVQEFRAAQNRAWSAVRERFERDKETGRWVPKTAKLEPRVARTAKKRAAR